MMMDNGIKMETIFGDGSQQQSGLFDKLLSAGKRVLTGEILKVDTGCIVGFSKEVDYDIEFIGGIKNTIFGSEGMFYATLRGPGTVYIQSLPFSRLANRIIASAPRSGGNSKEEGSLLVGIGRLLDGDR
jgi:uncharacterized protein (AIM24 family)